MQHPTCFDSATRKRRTVPWWKTQLSLFEPEPSVPERATDDPPAVPDRTQPTRCPDTLPKGIRDVYVSMFGLPVLYPEDACEAPTRRPVDADALRAEVVA